MTNEIKTQAFQVQRDEETVQIAGNPGQSDIFVFPHADGAEYAMGNLAAQMTAEMTFDQASDHLLDLYAISWDSWDAYCELD